ncbi:hypothetical protein MBLNU459_g1155t2 [Dothideomycetes sp. NU459]
MPSAMPANAGADGRVAKRQKVGADSVAPKAQRSIGASRLFAPYRTVGLVSPTAVPFTSVALGKTTFQLTTSVGRSLQTYDLRRGLNLVFITRPQTPELITASLAWKDLVFAAWGGADADSARGAWVYKRGKKIAELEIPKGLQSNMTTFCIFGSWIVACCNSQILVWKTATLELYTTLQGITASPFTGCITSMPTLLNKIVAGKEDGTVEIWNVSSGKLVYSILPPAADYGAVTALESTPALSLLAIAYEAGPLVIQDIQADRKIMQFNVGSQGSSGAAITSISFRTDGLGAGDDGRKSGVMATASTEGGDVTLWDLNNGGRKAGVLRGAHAAPAASAAGGVSKAEFLPGQSILVTSGLDNSLKTWIFDDTPFSPIPRILHSRSGHGAPVSTLAFLPEASDGSDAAGKWLLSTSQDRSLWGWSLRRDGQSTELSQGNVTKKARKAGILSSEGRDTMEALKAPPITCIACSLNRDGGVGAIPGKQPIWQGSGKGKSAGSTESSNMTGWESVVTAHEGDSKARTWFWGRKRAGRWAFETGDGGEVKSVAISPCGTFALVGSAMGGIDMFNLQSGIHRQRYPARLTPAQARQLKIDLLQAEEAIVPVAEAGKKKFYRGQGKHTGAVTGVAVDNLNKTVISCGTDGKIKFWDFHSGTLKHEIDWSGAVSITGMRLHRSSELAAFSCHDGCIRIIDTTTYRLVRELRMTRSPLPSTPVSFTDFGFSNDGRWITAATSAIVCAWDLPTGHLIDAFKLPSSCNALAFSPTGEYLATASSEHVGVDVWSNKTLFTHVPTRHINESELALITSSAAAAPTASGEGGQSLISAMTEASPSDDDDEEFDVEDLDTDLDVLSSDLVSLSLVPRSRWQNLLHLDAIRARNKPIAPPQKPEKAPFFLPSLQERQNNPALSSAEGAQALATLEQERSRIMKMDRAGTTSPFTQLLRKASEGPSPDYSGFVAHLKTLNPAAADVEIRSLSSATTSLFSSDAEQCNELVAFVQALVGLLESKRDFELGQAWMSVFLRVHADVVVEDEQLRNVVGQWRHRVGEEKERVEALSGYCGGMIGYLRAARV